MPTHLRNADAYAVLARQRAEAELYDGSDCNAVHSDAAGVVKSLPIVLKKSSLIADGSGESYVLFDGKYIQPERVPGFLRIELKPEARPKPVEPGPMDYPSACRATEAERMEKLSARQAQHRAQNNLSETATPLQRIAAKQREWIAESVRARLEARGRRF